MPLIEDMVNSVGQSRWFCLIDLKSAYWQVLMEVNSICKTAFSTQKGHYEFIRTSFGLVFAVFTFQGLADSILKEVRDWCRAYLDDLLSHAAIFEECCEGLRTVLKLLIKSKLFTSFSKCKFMMQEVPYLGYLLTKDGIKPDPAKTEAIRALKPPRDVPGLQHVLGLFQYYSKFHPMFSEVAQPLTSLTQKGKAWIWSAECQKAFEAIKCTLTSEPMLVRPDFSQPFIVRTDWSPLALGAILAQERTDETTGQKFEAVVYFASKKLRGAELNYAATEGDCQAVL